VRHSAAMNMREMLVCAAFVHPGASLHHFLRLFQGVVLINCDSERCSRSGHCVLRRGKDCRPLSAHPIDFMRVVW